MPRITTIARAAAAALLLGATLAGQTATDYEAPGAFQRGSQRPWAYTPLSPSPAPAVKNAKWVRAPLDAFVLAKLEAAGIQPSAEADRATYIRRATLEVNMNGDPAAGPACTRHVACWRSAGTPVATSSGLKKNSGKVRDDVTCGGSEPSDAATM